MIDDKWIVVQVMLIDLINFVYGYFHFSFFHSIKYKRRASPVRQKTAALKEDVMN